MQKRLLFLGGNHVQMTAIKAAKDQGYYVITADYLPNNPGHKIADEYHNVSTVNKDAILELAKGLRIDGIVSYASDVSAPTAAYVAEQLGLPTNPYDSVMVLTHKNLFRSFMAEHNYPMPKWGMFVDKNEARKFIGTSTDPWIIKPVDSSGSKGVTKITSMDIFDEAWEIAMRYSLAKEVIIEQFIEKQGYQIDGDIFVENGEIVFWGICDQHKDVTCAPYVPVGSSYPSTQHEVYQDKAKTLIASILKDLNMTMGAYNVEYIIGKDGEVYILEIGPRNGGNLIPDTICAATGYDMATNTIRQAVGEACLQFNADSKQKYCSSYIIHSQNDGLLKEIKIDPSVNSRILKRIDFVDMNDQVNRYTHGGYGIGALVIEFDSTEQMCRIIDSMNDYIQVNVN